MEHYDEFLLLVQNMKDDFDRFFNKNNKTAGSRLRKYLQELRKKSQDLRIKIQNIKNESLSATTTVKKTTAKPKTPATSKSVIGKSSEKTIAVKKNTKKK